MPRWPVDLNVEEHAAPAAMADVYRAGFAGVIDDPEADGELSQRMSWPTFSDVVDSFPFLGKGNGSTRLPGVLEDGLYLPFLAQLKCEAIAAGVSGSLADLSRDSRLRPWPEAQFVGDCVSHFVRNLCDLLRCMEICNGEPEAFITRGATEPIYGHRNHRGHGASCSRLLAFVSTIGGMFLRQELEIPNFGKLDLRKYNPTIGTKWGASGVPSAVCNFGKPYQIQDVTRCNTRNEIILAFQNGLPVGGCSSMGFSSERNEWGVSKPRSTWRHAMAWSGLDVRPSTLERYPAGLVLIQQSWGTWNRGPREIHDTPYLIPDGAFWADLGYVERNAGGFYAIAGANGWQLQPLDTLGSSW